MKKKYCFFIISCKKNIKLAEFQVKILQDALKKPVDIIVSFDDYVQTEAINNPPNVLFLNGKKEMSFGSRISNAVQSLDYPYVIVMCDDFIVEKEINLSEIDFLIRVLEDDKKISSIALARISGKNRHTYIEIGNQKKYVERNRFSCFKTTLQCAIWNKFAFWNLIKNAKSPWDFEIFQNYKTYYCCNKFYAIIDSMKSPIIYNRGCFMIRGKMVEPERKRLEKVLGIKISNLGYETTDSYIQDDGLSLFYKIYRRVILLVYEVIYRMYSRMRIKDLNIIN